MSEQIDKKISEQLDHSIAYIRHGNLGEAKNCLAVAHSFNRTHLDLHYVTGLYLSAVNNLELALDHLEKELRLFPTNDAAREFLRSLQFIKSNVQGETRTLRIASPGLCQSEVFASLLSRLLPNAHVKFFRVGTSSCQGPNFIHELNFEDFDHVIMPRLGDYFGKMSYQNCKTKPNVTFVPSIVFSGYHPDCIYINDDQARVFKSPIGDYHSLIVYCSFLHNLSVDECLALFQPDFYREFGFFQDYKNSMQLLIEELDLNGLDGTFLSQKWAMQGPFMYSFNHAKQFVLNDLAVAVCNRMGLKIRRGLSLDTIGADTLAAGPVLPVYPGLPGTQTTGQIYFKQSTLYPLQERSSSMILDLKEFVTRSFALYESKGKAHLRSDDRRVESFSAALDRHQRGSAKSNFKHPYRNLPTHAYWSKAVAKLDSSEVDPVVNFSLLIDPETKVATAGSCFAQHIARTLQKSGLNYFVAETGPEDQGYGLFSARFGNLYGARQLLQLFERAYGLFTPTETHWRTADGTFLDPFRPNLGEKFASLEALEADQKSHFKSVRKMFEELDVFVFTLGLTEAWQNTVDGAVYPVAPGVVSQNVDKNQYQFINFSCEQIREDMLSFLGNLRRVNPKAKVILTVSPVPLIATYENRHVLSSTTLSKSVLRTVADELSRAFSFVEYFPSYEIITGNFNRGSYFADDLRDVKEQGVNHVMRLFLKHCTTLGDRKTPVVAIESATSSDELASLRQAQSDIAKVICDEELLTS